MAYPNRFLRLVVSGSLHRDETFSYGLTLCDPLEEEIPTTVPDTVENAVRTFHSVVASSAAKIESIKLNLIGTNGRYVSSTNTVERLIDPPWGGQNPPLYPPQVALAITLDTGERRGLARVGRFYVPSPSGNLLTDTGQYSNTHVTNARDAAVNFITSLNDALPGGWYVGVNSDVREGAQRYVKSVRVGRVLDTMRSRRKSIPEEYLAGAIPNYPQFDGGGGGFE